MMAFALYALLLYPVRQYLQLKLGDNLSGSGCDAVRIEAEAQLKTRLSVARLIANACHRVLFYSGDANAKPGVRAFVDRAGFFPFDLGTLDGGEPLASMPFRAVGRGELRRDPREAMLDELAWWTKAQRARDAEAVERAEEMAA